MAGHRDSGLAATKLTPPTLPDRLSERGWGPIRFRAGEGYNTRATGTFSAGFWFEQWRAQGWDAPNVLINLGANDSGICVTDQACARTSIQRVIDIVGPGHHIWWPQITRLFTKFPEQENWNQALRHFAAERDDFTTWDWPAELSQYPSPDGTHLTPDGYRARSVRMAQVFTRDMARGERVGGDAALPAGDREPIYNTVTRDGLAQSIRLRPSVARFMGERAEKMEQLRREGLLQGRVIVLPPPTSTIPEQAEEKAKDE